MSTLLLRSLIIILGSTCTAFALVNAADASDSGFLSGFGSWLGDVVTGDLPAGLWDGLLVTSQLAIIGVLVGCVFGALFAAVSRQSLMERVLRSALTPIAGLVAPALALSVGYWFGDRFDLLSDRPFTGLFGTAADSGGIGTVVFPALVVALSVAPALTLVFRRPNPALAEIGWASIAAPLAGRSTSHNQWTHGFPTGPLLLSLAVIEPIAVPDGLFTQFVEALAPLDPATLMGVVLIVAIGGVLLTLARDLLGPLVTPDDTRRLGGTRPRQEGRAGAIAFSVGMVGLAGFVMAALIAINMNVSTSDVLLSGPLSDGFLFGSDGSGRDLLNLAVAATGPVLQRALIPALAASVLGTALALGTRAFGRTGGALIESIADLLWWPAPLIGLLAVRAFGHGDETLLIIAAMLIPFAMRLARREVIGFNAGVGRRFGGTVALVAAAAFAIDTTIKFLRPPSRIDTGWGQQLAAGAEVLGESVWPAMVAGTAALLFVTVLQLVGSYLVSSGWSAWLASPEAVIGAADLEAEEIAAAEAAKPKPIVHRPALMQRSAAPTETTDEIDEAEADHHDVQPVAPITEEIPVVAVHAEPLPYEPVVAAASVAEPILDLTDETAPVITPPPSPTSDPVIHPPEPEPVYATVGAVDTPQNGQSVWSTLQTEDQHQFTNWADDVDPYENPPPPPPTSVFATVTELDVPPPPPPPTPEFIAPPPPQPDEW